MKYDVIIIGGGTAGCSCAYNCAKLGLKTLLVEKESYLGGTMTGALVVPVMLSGENQINTDFYTDLIKIMKSKNAQITYQNNPGWFNPIVLKDVLKEMLLTAGADIVLNAETDDIKIVNNKIASVKLNGKNLSVCNNSIYTNNTYSAREILSEYIDTIFIVDSTGNLNFCEKINCNFLENKNEYPPLSLRFIMSGINLKAFANWLLEVDTDRNVTSAEHIDGQIHLSTAYTWDTDKHWALAKYFDDAVSKNILKDTDRNYFQVFSIAGMPDSLAFNCPRILETLNPYNESDIQTALNIGKSAIKRLAEFCKIYFPGFEDAKVAYIADKVGIRASKRMKGKYIYTIDDLRSGKRFEHPAVISNYPIDVHSKNKNSSTLEMTGEYQLPIESLMSDDYKNLYTAGRGLSADEMAQGALRVQSSCFSMGEAVAKDIYSKIKN